MAQRGLSYEYEIEEGKLGLTAMGGLPTYLDLAKAIPKAFGTEINRQASEGMRGSGMDRPSDGHVCGVAESCRG